MLCVYVNCCVWSAVFIEVPSSSWQLCFCIRVIYERYIVNNYTYFERQLWPGTCGCGISASFRSICGQTWMQTKLTFSCRCRHASLKLWNACSRWVRIVIAVFTGILHFVFLALNRVFSDVEAHSKFLPCSFSPKCVTFVVTNADMDSNRRIQTWM